MGVTRQRRRTHDAARTHPAANHGTPGRRPHRSHQPLLLEHRGRPRARTELWWTPEHDGADPGARRSRCRRGRGPRGASRSGGRSRMRVGHAAVRRLLPVPSRARGHVSVPRSSGPGRPRADRRHARRHARVCELTHRWTRGGDGLVRRVGGAGLHEGNGRRSRHGLQLRQPSRDSARRRLRRSPSSSQAPSSRSWDAARSD